jgi:predicted aspartyl protease
MAVYSYLFDETKSPSMPVMDVKVIEPSSGVTVGPLSALVDTGADGTLVPKHLREDMGAIPIGRGLLRWLWDESRHVQIYLVRLEIGPHVLRGVHVAGIPNSKDFILGRNVLNHFVFTVDGPAGVIEIPA